MKISIVIILILISMNSYAKDTLTWGFMTDKPADILPRFTKFMNYIIYNMKDSNIKKWKIIPVKTIPEMIDKLNKKEIDFWCDSPFPVVIVNKFTKTEIPLKQWRYGQEKYHSVIFTKYDSQIEKYGDMINKEIVFENKYSSSAYFLPKLTLIDNKLKPVMKLSNKDDSNEVKYRFSGSNENTIIWVLFNKVDIGATSNTEYDLIPKYMKSNLKIIGRSISIPRFLLLWRKDLDNNIKIKLKNVLINMGKNKDGRDILNNVLKKAKFQEIDEQTLNELNKIKTLVPHIEKEINN